MDVAIKRWGNSLAIRLPKSLVDGLGLKEEEGVSLIKRGNNLVLIPKTKEEQLRQLLSAVEKQEEVDFGERVGNEW